MSINSQHLPLGISTLFSVFQKEIDLLVQQPIIIAIDGHSSCGKSTLAVQLSTLTGYTHLDSGAMYRAVTQYFLANDIDYNNEEAVRDALGKITIEFQKSGDKGLTVLNGIVVEDEIRSMLVSEHVSPVAAISAVRSFLVGQQRTLGKNKGVIMDGRDIGTVVFPHAEVKLFITASIDIRTERRYNELVEKGIENITKAEVATNLSDRDRIDSNRADSPLKKADDSLLMDTSDMKHKDQLEYALKAIFSRHQQLRN